MKKILISLLVALICFGMFGCNKAQEKEDDKTEAAEDEETSEVPDKEGETEENQSAELEESEEPEEPEEPEEDEGAARTEAFSFYSEVLRDSESAIRSYDWQNGNSPYKPNPEGLKPVSFCDVNGDGIEELFLVRNSAEYPGVVAVLHVYSVIEGKPPMEIVSSMGGRYENYSHDNRAFLQDHMAAAGTDYVVYLGTDGNLYIFGTAGSDFYKYWISVYKINEVGEAWQELNLDNSITYSDDHSETYDEYFIDGTLVDNEEGMKAFTDAFSKVDKVILFSDLRNDKDVSLWKRFDKEDALQMSFDDAMNYVQTALGGAS